MVIKKKKKDPILNYYNVVYKHSKFHNKSYFFLRYLDIGGKFINSNFLKKNYYKYLYKEDLSYFSKSLGVKKKSIDLSKKNKNENNLNFINFYNKNQNYVLRCYSDAKLNFRIVKNINSLSTYASLNEIFHDSLFTLDQSIDVDYFNIFFYLFYKSIFNYFLKYFNIYILIKFLKNNYSILNLKFKNLINMSYSLIKTNKKKYKLNFFLLFSKIMKFYKKRKLIKGENLKEFLLNAYKIFIENSNIKLPVNVSNLKKKFSIKSNIFTIYKSNINIKVSIEFFVLSYIKKYHNLLRRLKNDKIKEIEDLEFSFFSNFFYFLFRSLKSFLFHSLNKSIKFKHFSRWKISILNSIFEFSESVCEDRWDYFDLLNDELILKKIKLNQGFLFFFDFFNFYSRKIEFWKYAYENFLLNKSNKHKFYNNAYYTNFIFNTLKGKEIKTFKEFYSKVYLNILFLKNIPRKFFKNKNLNIDKLRNISGIKSIIGKIVYLRDLDYKLYCFLKLNIFLFYKKLKYIWFHLFYLSFKNKIIKKIIKKTIKYFFLEDRVELLNLKKYMASFYDLNTILKYIQFSNEIDKDRYYFKTNKITVLYINLHSKYVIQYKRKKVSNLNLIRACFKIFNYLKLNSKRYINYKKKLLRYILFTIYIVVLRNNLIYDFKNYKREIKKVRKVRKVRKVKKVKKDDGYLEKKRKYAELVKRWIKEKRKYTLDYFKQAVRKDPQLFQSESFNRKIVRYRVESIYRTTDDSIRPNPALNKRIWEWIKIRNAQNRAARAFFSKEINFKFL